LISSIDEVSVAWLGPAPAHANDAFAGLHALGEGLGCRGHGTVASEVGAILDGKVFDDLRDKNGSNPMDAGERHGLAAKASSIPRASRRSAALALERENSTSLSSGRWAKSWPLALRGLKETVIGGLQRLGAS
jgi:hypothetical protein